MLGRTFRNCRSVAKPDTPVQTMMIFMVPLRLAESDKEKDNEERRFFNAVAVVIVKVAKLEQPSIYHSSRHKFCK